MSTFVNKPINQDQSLILSDESGFSVFDCLNFRPVTSQGLSQGSRENIRGNADLIQVPIPTDVYKLQFDEPIARTFTLTVDGSPVVINLDGSPTMESYCYQMIEVIGTLLGANFKVVIDDTNSWVYIYSPNCTVYTITSTETGLSLYIAALTVPPNIMGWCSLAGKIYLLTTPEFGDNPSSIGQWWEIDKTVPSCILIYNNYLNVSLKYPVANPSGIETADQNENIKKIYWTDNKNFIRNINVVDPNLFGIHPDSLGSPKVIWTSPYIVSINQGGGSVITGYHLFSYRYRSFGNGVTNWSPESYKILINEKNDETTDYREYYSGAAGVNSKKSISFSFKSLNPGFDYVELAHLYSKSGSTIDQVEIIDLVMPNADTINYTFTGSEKVIPYTLSEFRDPIYPLKAKTIASKNNILFAGNIKVTKKELTGYDTRAIRFPKGGTNDNETQTSTVVYDSNGIQSTIDSNTWSVSSIGVPEDHDCIQPIDPLNEATVGESQNPLDRRNLLYSFDLAGSVVDDSFGGSGPNISYQFLGDLDTMHFLSDTAGGNTNAYHPYKQPLKKTSNFTFLLNPNDHTEIVSINTFSDYTSPYIASVFGQYQRDEVYAFAIEFFDLYGKPYMAKWIADIRFPRIYMPKRTGSDPTALAIRYPLAYSPNTYTDVVPMGISFEVRNLDKIRDRVSGFRIVRCVRTPDDKTVSGQGCFTTADYSSNDAVTYLLPRVVNDPDGITINQTSETDLLWEYRTSNQSAHKDQSTVSQYIASIESPEHIYNKFSAPATHLSIETVLDLTDDNSDISYALPAMQGTNGIPNGNQSASAVGKYYTDNVNLPSAFAGRDGNGLLFRITDNNITEHITNDRDEAITIGGLTVKNRDHTYNDAGNNQHEAAERGDKTCLLYSADGDFLEFGEDGANYVADDLITNSNGIYLANMKRDIEAYGGYSYVQRANREYIPCTNFIPYTQATETVKVFYGDTYVNLWATNKYKKGYGVGIANILNNVVRIFPVESQINTDLAVIDKRIDKDYFPNTGEGMDLGTGYDYYRFVSYQADGFIYYPKPYPFIETTHYSRRIMATEAKLQDELLDSWTIFKVNKFIDVDDHYGPITALMRVKDNLVFLQEDAIGVASVNDRTLLQTNETSKLVLGTGEVLSRVDYVSMVSGSKHQFGLILTPNGLIYFDVKNKKLMNYNPGGEVQSLNDIRGLHGFFIDNVQSDLGDNPYLNNGFTGTYDQVNNEALLTHRYLLPNGTLIDFTIGVNAEGFTSFYSFKPKVYINDRESILTPNPSRATEDLYIHNQNSYNVFYDSYYPSQITIAFNKDQGLTKEFTNAQLLSRVQDSSLFPIFAQSNKIDSPRNNELPDESFTDIRFYNSFQNTDWQTFNSVAKRKEKTWNVIIPRNRVTYNGPNQYDIFDPLNISPTRILYGASMRDKYLFIDLKYNQTDSKKKFIFDLFDIKYLNSLR